jgi:DNA-directed RNA polymerase sigma subunit (sigma70/sigma32)
MIKEEKTRLTSDQIDDLVEKYISLKQKSKTDKKINKEFVSFEKEFVYHMNKIIDLYTYKYKRFSNYEDLRQDAFQSLMLAVDSFKRSKGKFVGWVKMYSKTKVFREANKHSALKVPMEKAKTLPPIKVSMEDYEMEKRPDLKDSPEQTVIKNNLWFKIKKSFQKLSKNELKVIEYHFKINDEFSNITELCSSLSLSAFDYKNILKNAVKKIEVDLNLKKIDY